MADKRQFESIKFSFSADELRDLGLQLARENQAVYTLESKKKLDSTEIASQIKAANSRAEATTLKLNNGYEMRECEVLVMFDEPIEGHKRTVRLDTNAVVRDEPMTADEKQRGLDFGG